MDPSGGSSNPSGDSSFLHVILATGVACIKAAPSISPSQTAATTNIDDEPLDCGDSVEGDECHPGFEEKRSTTKAVENSKRKLEDNNTSSQNKKKVRVFEERSNKLNWRVYRILTHTLF